MNEKQMKLCIRFIKQAQKDKSFVAFLEKEYQLTREEALNMSVFLYGRLSKIKI